MKRTSVYAITAAALTFAAAAPFPSLAAYRTCGLPEMNASGCLPDSMGNSGLFNISGLPGISCVTDIFASPDAAGIAGIPYIPGTPGMSDFPCVPGSPDAPGISDFPYIPGTPNAPGISDFPCIPGSPDAPEIPDFPCIPGSPDAPGISDFPCIPGSPDAPGIPDLPTVPDTPDLPVVPDIPATPGTPDVPGTTVPPTTEADNAAARIIELVNAERAKAGLAPLSLNTTASSAALTRAKETVSVFSHTRPDGRNFSTALTEAGISYSFCGENIAYGQTTPEQVMNDWMNSSGHRANILQSNFSQIGIGHYISGNGTQYWVQLFLN